MSNKTSSTIKNKTLSVLKFILLAAACVFASIILVWPLWKFSTEAPKIYTIITLSLISCFLIYLIIKKIRKCNWKSVLKFFVILLLFAAGLFFTVKFVLYDKKLLALLALLITIGLIIVVNIIFNRIRHE